MKHCLEGKILCWFTIMIRNIFRRMFRPGDLVSYMSGQRISGTNKDSIIGRNQTYIEGDPHSFSAYMATLKCAKWWGCGNLNRINIPAEFRLIQFAQILV